MSFLSLSNQTIQTKGIKHLALGGTFDHFHKGHRHFLNKAFKLSSLVTIGITADAFASNIHKDSRLESFADRKSSVDRWLRKNHLRERTNIITLNDSFGTTTKAKNLQALLITQNTEKAGKDLNHQRIQAGLSPLELIRCPLIRAEDGKTISSRRIRDGQIDREGLHYYSVLLSETPSKVTETLVQKFRIPFGVVVPANPLNMDAGIRKARKFINEHRLHPVISVGDLVTQAFIKTNGIPKLAIVDLKVRREIRFTKLSDIGPIGHLQTYTAVNSPGIITKEFVTAIQQAMETDSPAVIQVDGEEDLGVLPAVLLAPLGSVVLYGHFQYGVIAVEVSEAKKSESLKLLRQLEKISG